jgi:hypothetical protein
MGCSSMSVRHVQPKQALNPETSKKEETLSERPYLSGFIKRYGVPAFESEQHVYPTVLSE